MWLSCTCIYFQAGEWSDDIWLPAPWSKTCWIDHYPALVERISPLFSVHYPWCCFNFGNWECDMKWETAFYVYHLQNLWIKMLMLSDRMWGSVCQTSDEIMPLKRQRLTSCLTATPLTTELPCCLIKDVHSPYLFSPFHRCPCIWDFLHMTSYFSTGRVENMASVLDRSRLQSQTERRIIQEQIDSKMSKYPR